MNRQGRLDKGKRIVGLTILLLVMTVALSSLAAAQGTPIMLRISPLTNKVAGIPAVEAEELFINALMETNHFAILPPDAHGSYARATYVLALTISEARRKPTAPGFLKEVEISQRPVNLTIRVFDPRTNALLKSVIVRGTEFNNTQAGLNDARSQMDTFGARKGDQSGKNEPPDKTAQLEERIRGVMQQAAARLAAQLGVGAAGGQPGTRPCEAEKVADTLAMGPAGEQRPGTQP